MRELIPFAVLPAGQFHPGPHPVFLTGFDRLAGALTLLRQWAPPQTDRARLGGGLFVNARLGRSVTGVVIGVAKPQFGLGRTRAMVHLGLLLEFRRQKRIR